DVAVLAPRGAGDLTPGPGAVHAADGRGDHGADEGRRGGRGSEGSEGSHGADLTTICNWKWLPVAKRRMVADMGVSAQQKMDRYRARRDDGLEVWSVEVDPEWVKALLKDAEILTPWADTDDRAVLAAALSKLIRDWSEPR